MYLYQFTEEASMAKLFASEMGEAVCSKAMHRTGAIGYTRDLLLEKYLRDAKAMTIIEVPSEIQRRIIAEDL